jgi:hypothetical protein
MSERFESPMPIDSREIDRLVDGELNANEERSLLTALEFQPDGWRRCALAFLETRAWKTELGLITRQAWPRIDAAPMNGTPMTAALPKPRAADTRWARAFAIAACIGLAFYLGIVVRGQWTEFGKQADRELAGTGAAAEDDLGAGNNMQPHSVAKPLLTMAVVDNQGDVERQLEIPVVEADGLNAGWLTRRPAAMSPQQIETLENYGYRVDQERLYVPVILEDGRQAIVSLDRAAVKYNGLQF